MHTRTDTPKYTFKTDVCISHTHTHTHVCAPKYIFETDVVCIIHTHTHTHTMSTHIHTRSLTYTKALYIISFSHTYRRCIRGVNGQIRKTRQNTIKAIRQVTVSEDLAIKVRDENGSEFPVVIFVVHSLAHKEFDQPPLQVLNVHISQLFLGTQSTMS